MTQTTKVAHRTDYRAEPIEERVQGVDAVFDNFDGDTLRRSWSVLKPGGRLGGEFPLAEAIRAYQTKPLRGKVVLGVDGDG